MLKLAKFKAGLLRAAPVALALALTACGSGGDLSGTGGKEVLSFGSSNLPAAYENEPYQADLAVSGGVNPYTLRVTSGDLPPGVALQGSQLVGTPTKQGRYEFIVEATDGSLSTRAQTYAISVGNLPALSLALNLPAGTFRSDTRVPLTLSYPRATKAARFQWKLPAGVKVSRVEPGAAGQELLLWKQSGPLLTLDVAFTGTGAPQSGANVALIGLSFAKPVTLDGATSAFEARAMDGKLVAEKKFADAAKPAAPAKGKEAAPNTTTPNTTTPGTTTPATTTPDNATPSTAPGTTDPNAAPATPDQAAPGTTVPAPTTPDPSTPGTPPSDGSSDTSNPPVNPPSSEPPPVDPGSGS